MRVLFKKVELCFPGHKFHGHKRDVLLEYNKVGDIGIDLSPPERTKVLEGGILTPGLVDIGAFSGEPGFEHRETIRTLTKAAARGGYTHLFVVPNLNPVTDNRSTVQYLKDESRLIDIRPIGAISKGLGGKDLAEIYDMHQAGVGAFSDGLVPVSDVGLMKRSLQYVKTFDGLIINRPLERSIEVDGLIHESKVSTQMGLKGIPEISETIMLKRDIDLLEYTESRLLSHQVSTEESIRILKQARKTNNQLFASVAFLNLIRTVDDVQHFDTNYLVLPPLRNEKDRQALIKSLIAGHIDCIVSGHLPVEEEWKKIEFAEARFGASTLPMVFPALHDILHKRVNIDQLIQWLSINPRRIMGIDQAVPDIESPIDFTWIDPDQKTKFTAREYPSKSKNTSLLDHTWHGSIKGVFYQENYELF